MRFRSSHLVLGLITVLTRRQWLAVRAALRAASCASGWTSMRGRSILGWQRTPRRRRVIEQIYGRAGRGWIRSCSRAQRSPNRGRRSPPTVWVFTLRKNVRFHDGTPLTAADVVFSTHPSRSKPARAVAGVLYIPITKIEAVDDATCASH